MRERSSSPRERGRTEHPTTGINNAQDHLASAAAVLGGERVPWGMLPSMMAALMQMSGANGPYQNQRDEQEIRELKDDVRRLRRQRNEGEKKTAEAQKESEEVKRKADELKSKVHYLEHKVEYLRRELVRRHRDRSPAGEMDKTQEASRMQLIDVITKYELRHGLADTVKGSKANDTPSESLRRMDVCEDPKTAGPTVVVDGDTRGTKRSLEERIKGSKSMRLVSRLDPPAAPRAMRTHEVGMTPRSHTVNMDVPATALAIANRLVPMMDEHGERIIPAGPMQGFRIIYGIVIDLLRSLPKRPPTAGMINPLTGRPWTEHELVEYPFGIPGWDSNASLGMGKQSWPVRRVNLQRLQELDRSHELVKLPKITAEEGVPPWRFPATPAEADHLRDVALAPCNLMALEFWGRFLQHCYSTERTVRNALQSYVATLKFQRPSWAPYKRSGNSAAKQERKILRRKERVEEGRTNTEAGGTTVPVQFGSTTGEEVSGATMAEEEPPQEATTPPNAMRVRAVPEREGLWAGSVQSKQWTTYLNAHPEVIVPGITRTTDGLVKSELAVRGMLRVGQLGCEDASGRLTIAFVTEVARFIGEQSYQFSPSQLMNGLVMMDPADMTSERIQAHLRLLTGDTSEHPIISEADSRDYDGIVEWLSVVDPEPEPAVSDGEDDAMDMRG